MKKIFFLAICWFISLQGISQGFRKTDFVLEYQDLIKGRNSDKNDTTKVLVLNNLANRHKFSRPDSGIYYATKALELAQALSLKEEELFALQSLELSYITLGNYITAHRIGLEGLRKAEEYSTGHQGWFLTNLGTEMHYNLNYEASLDYFQKAYKEFTRINNQRFVPIASAYLGRVHWLLGNPDSAFFYSYQAKQLAESVNLPWVRTFTYDRIGEIHRDLHHTDSAFYYFKLSSSLRNESSQKITGLLEIAKLFEATDQPDSALYYAQQSMDMALEYKLFEDITTGALFFSNFYEKSDPSKAFQYHKMALAYKDSLENLSKMTGFADLGDFDERLRQAELQRAKKEYQSQLRTNSFLGTTFTFLIIAFILFRNNRQKQKAKQKIENAYTQLKSTQAQLIQSEKMASLGELTAGIAHEIQNPLNFVNNFSEVNRELIAELKEEIEKGDLGEVKLIATDIEANEEKITLHGKRADAIVKGMLEHSKRGSGQKELTNLNALADEFLRLSYQSFLAKEPDFKCELKTDLAPDLPQVSVIPQDIGKVLLNLINNAFYAVHEKAKSENADPDYKPIIVVSSTYSPLSGGQGGFIVLSVQDNGSGIPDSIKEKIFQPFFTTKPTGSGTGLGLSLSYDIVKAHGGELKVESKQGDGSDFIIRLMV
jgi:two-component system NtrC family sensor kinase